MHAAELHVLTKWFAFSIFSEQQTLELLKKFQAKLDNVKSSTSTENQTVKPINDTNYDDVDGDDWLSHKLSFQEPGAILAKDASTKSDQWHDIYDPRNALNKRKRGEEKHRHRDDSKRNRHWI